MRLRKKMENVEHKVEKITREHMTEIIERDNDAKIVSFDDFTIAYPEMALWIFSLQNKMMFFSSEERVFLKFFTDKYEYKISVRRWTDEKNDGGYLGCTVNNRSSKAGETWVRGNDLPDGKYSHHTWNEILRGIVNHEMVELNI